MQLDGPRLWRKHNGYLLRDQALCAAIEAAVLQEVAASDTPERGSYEI